MRIVLCLFVCLVLAASSVNAQPGSVGVFADPGGTSCDIYDTVPGLVMIYVVHVFTAGASGCQFRVDDSAVYMTYLAETVTSPYLSIGQARFGIAITYGMCVGSPNMVMNLTYFASASTAPCSFVKVVDDPTASPPGIYVVDCVAPIPNLLTATGGTAVVNPTGNCMCNVPAEDTSWGQIKHLYR